MAFICFLTLSSNRHLMRRLQENGHRDKEEEEEEEEEGEEREEEGERRGRGERRQDSEVVSE